MKKKIVHAPVKPETAVTYRACRFLRARYNSSFLLGHSSALGQDCEQARVARRWQVRNSGVDLWCMARTMTSE